MNPQRVSSATLLPGDNEYSDVELNRQPVEKTLCKVFAPPGTACQFPDLTEQLQTEYVGREWIYCELFQAQWGPFVECWTLRTTDAKLTYFSRDRTGLLFDLINDPDERCDLYNNPDYQNLKGEMTANLLEEIGRQADPLPKVLSQF